MTWLQWAGRNRVAVAATVIAVACGDDGPTGNTGTIQVAVSAATLDVPQGTSGSVSVALTRGGGFTGTVTLALTGLPAGATATIAPTELSGTTANAAIEVTVGATVALGAYTPTITATAQGVGQATTTFQLNVTAAPGFGLSVTPAALPIAAGTSGTTTVGIDRTNFTGGVALSLANPPAGITGVFTPTPATTNSSALVVSVAAQVAPGNYPLTIRGTAAGLADRVATLQLTVTPPSTGGNNVEYRFCHPDDVPAFFAYQDGTGAWQAVTGSTSGGTTTFAFNITQGRGGAFMVFRAESSSNALSAGQTARARPSALRDRFNARIGPRSGDVRVLSRAFGADYYDTYLLYASTAELAQDGVWACDQSPPTRTVTGTVLGVPANAFGIVHFGYSSEVFIGGTSTNPLSFEVPAGLNDLVASRMAVPGTAPDRIVIMRNLDIPHGGALPSPIDFNGTAAVAPATANVTITGASGDNLETFVTVVTANREVGVWFDLAPSPATTRPWAGLSPTTMMSSDFHGLIVFANQPGNSGDFRVTVKYVGPVSNQSLALGPRIDLPATSLLAGGAYPRYRFQGTLPPDYDKGVAVDLSSSDDDGNFYHILATGAYLAGSGNARAYDLAMPDVAGVAGFPHASRLTAGVTDVGFDVWGFTGPGVFDLVPIPGSEFKAAVRRTSINVQ